MCDSLITGVKGDGGEEGCAQTRRHETARMESRQLHARKEREMGGREGGRAADHRAEERTADDQHRSVWITHKLPERMREWDVRRPISYQREMSTCVCEEGVEGNQSSEMLIVKGLPARMGNKSGCFMCHSERCVCARHPPSPV